MRIEVWQADGPDWLHMAKMDLTSWGAVHEVAPKHLAAIETQLQCVGEFIGGGGAIPYFRLTRICGR